MSLFSLEGKVALITGSTKGIGKAIAQRMAEQGAKVVISSRNQELCDEVAGEINESGGTAIAVACNINYKEQLENLVAQTEQQLGKLDVLVCNAAINPYFGTSQEIPDSAFDNFIYRWLKGKRCTRCVRNFKGSGHANCKKSRRGMGS